MQGWGSWGRSQGAFLPPSRPQLSQDERLLMLVLDSAPVFRKTAPWCQSPFQDHQEIRWLVLPTSPTQWGLISGPSLSSAQRGQVTCLRSPSKLVMGLRLGQGLPDSLGEPHPVPYLPSE